MGLQGPIIANAVPQTGVTERDMPSIQQEWRVNVD